MEYYKEYWERWECRYWLREIISCRKCLFETLCRLEKDKKETEKKERKREWGTLNNNANTNENVTTEIIND